MSEDQSPARFEASARAAVDGFPDVFRSAARDVALRVVDWPSREMLREVGLHHRSELTGLYEGVPMTQKSTWDQPMQPDTVWLFREPILGEWRTRGDVTLEALIAHVTVHEFAHHFGWSDADIARVDRWWE